MYTASEKFYDKLTFLYPIVDVFLKPQKFKFFSKINGYPRGRLLEIGVGNGTHFKYYNTHNVVGIETSRSMLSRARKNSKHNIQLFHMNGEDLLFPNEAFDYVILSHVIAVVDNPEELFNEVYRVLKPNGKVFILNHFTPDNGLQYLDKAFETFSKLLHFKSVFHLSRLCKPEKFRLLNQFNAGLFSYFKILVYEKSH